MTKDHSEIHRNWRELFVQETEVTRMTDPIGENEEKDQQNEQLMVVTLWTGGVER